MPIEVDKVITLYTSVEAWQKIMAYIHSCSTEINGFGYVRKLSNTSFVLDDIFIIDQVVTGGTAEVVDGALNRHMEKMSDEGLDKKTLHFQWHSHVDMQAFFSGTDMKTIEEYSGQYMISLVANKQGDYQARLDVYRPIWISFPVKVVFSLPIDEQILLECQEDIVQHLTELPYGIFRKKSRTYQPLEVVESINLTPTNRLGC